jgi:hypothetical protein
MSLLFLWPIDLGHYICDLICYVESIFECESSSDTDVDRDVISISSVDYAFNIEWEPNLSYRNSRYLHGFLFSLRRLTKFVTYPQKRLRQTIRR